MSESNGNNGHTSKWTMWAIGFMLTIGIAANGMTVNWVNSKFMEHESRTHKDSVPKDRFQYIYIELQEIKAELKITKEKVIRLEERLRGINIKYGQ